MEPCFICGGNASHYANWEVYEYAKCYDCELIYLKEMPSEEAIYKAYDGGKFKSLRRKITAPFRSLEQLSGYAERVPDFIARLKLAMPYLNNVDIDKKPRLLDIGCNKGFLLTAAINLGFDVAGVELIPELTIQFRRKYPQYADNVFSEDFSKVNIKLGREPFDMITAFDLVEHLRTPRTDFEQICGLIKPGGVFQFQTPNTKSPEAQSKGEKWGALKAYEHYQLFNPANIEMFGNQLGFSSVRQIESDLLCDGDMMVVMVK